MCGASMCLLFEKPCKLHHWYRQQDSQYVKLVCLGSCDIIIVTDQSQQFNQGCCKILVSCDVTLCLCVLSYASCLVKLYCCAICRDSQMSHFHAVAADE